MDDKIPFGKRRYTVKTYDYDLGKWTAQQGTKTRPYKISLRQVRRLFRELQAMGYPCNRNQDDSDPSVSIERVV